jgi:hypothetical protein
VWRCAVSRLAATVMVVVVSGKHLALRAGRWCRFPNMLHAKRLHICGASPRCRVTPHGVDGVDGVDDVDDMNDDK